MRLTSAILGATLLLGSAVFAQTAGQDVKQAGRDVKDAGSETGKATAKTAKKAKKKVKKTTHRAASKVEQKTRDKQ